MLTRTHKQLLIEERESEANGTSNPTCDKPFVTCAAEYNALESAAYDLYDMVQEILDDPDRHSRQRLMAACDALGELLPATKAGK